MEKSKNCGGKREKEEHDFSDQAMELKQIKLDLIDRLAPYEISSKDLYAYEEEVRALLSFPSNERAKRFNKLVDKIRSQHKKRGGR